MDSLKCRTSIMQHYTFMGICFLSCMYCNVMFSAAIYITKICPYRYHNVNIA